MNKRDIIVLPICGPLNVHEQSPILEAIDIRFLPEASSKSQVYVCKQQRLRRDCAYDQVRLSLFWPRGYKTFFMLNSTEHEIFHANKSQITKKKCNFFPA